MDQTVLAADLGGTHFRAALVDGAGRVLYRAERPTPMGPADRVVAEVVDLLEGVVASSRARPAGVCIAVAGMVDGDGGRVIASPNIPVLRDVEFARPVSGRLEVPAFVENDASAAALGEARFGAGRHVRHLLHVTLGTGIGGGIVIDRRLYRGASGTAGEVGHIILDPGGERCNCGSRGCLEALVSGVAFARRAKRLLLQGKAPVLATLVAGGDPTAEDLSAAAQAGDAFCEAEIRNGGHVLGLGLGSVVNVLNPGAVTLSGGLLAMGEMLLGPAREAMTSLAYGPAAATPVLIGELGDDAGLLGAAAVAFERLGS